MPKVLAQHHCNPPPSPKAMAEWMKELRKRNAKLYAIMQRDVRELQLYRERKEGYQESVTSDKERKLREAEELQQKLAAEKAEQERLEVLKERRKELLESLPEEPDSATTAATDIKTMSVRFPDGRVGRRKFTSDTKLSDVFNWVDAVFEVEREVVILTTLDGKQTFAWVDPLSKDNLTLQQAGLGRMVGFRVSEKKVQDETKECQKEEEEADDDGEEEEEE